MFSFVFMSKFFIFLTLLLVILFTWAIVRGIAFVLKQFGWIKVCSDFLYRGVFFNIPIRFFYLNLLDYLISIVWTIRNIVTEEFPHG